jgi:hypothetical protein
MYQDKDPWPFKCPECGEEFTEEIGRLKAQFPGDPEVSCPRILNPVGPVPCPVTLTMSAEEFRSALAQAQAGRYDPFEDVWGRKQRR